MALMRPLRDVISYYIAKGKSDTLHAVTSSFFFTFYLNVKFNLI